MATNRPSDLRDGGSALWDGVTSAHDDLNDTQLVQLVEACRAKDRLDRLDQTLAHTLEPVLLSQANTTANLLKQLLAAMRLPDDVTGKRPTFRSARGVQMPDGSAPLSALDRARNARRAG